jgi:hypothetical protein
MTAADFIDNNMAQGVMWNCSSRISQMGYARVSEVLGSIWRLSMILLFIVVSFQIVLIVYKALVKKESPVSESIPLVFKTVIIVLLIHPSIYSQLNYYCIARPANAVADMITATYVEGFRTSVSALFSSLSNSTSVSSHFLTSSFSDSIMSSLISGVVFFCASIMVFVTTILQSAVYTMLYFLGPVCIAFGVFEFTSGVAKAWIGLSLAVAWTGVIGSGVFLCMNAMGVLDGVAVGSSASNSFVSLIYGVISIIAFGMCYPITSFFFDSSATFSKTMSGGNAVASTTRSFAGGAAVGAAAAMAAGSLSKGTGSMLSRFSSEGSKMDAIGKSLSDYGTNALNAGQEAYNFAFPWSTSSTNKIASIMGSTAKGMKQYD